MRCLHADDPTRRPDCTRTAIVWLGPSALCPPCQPRGATFGKGEELVALHEPSVDVLDWLQAAEVQLTHAERVLASAVTRARQASHSWAAIGTRLKITGQSAWQRLKAPVTLLVGSPGPSGPPGRA